MTRLSAFLAALLLVGCGTGRTADSPTFEAIDQLVGPYVESGNFAGTVLVARGDSILHERAYGPADCVGARSASVATRYHIASVSKPVTAAAVLLLVEERLLDPSDPVATYVPDFPRGTDIRIEDLLVHTSGIPDINGFAEYDSLASARRTTDELVRAFAGRSLGFEPGERYGYSNSNYNLLAHLIELRSGRPFGTFLRRRIFAPLGMANTAHDTTDGSGDPSSAPGCTPVGLSDLEPTSPFNWSVKTGNGSLVSTARDLYDFTRAIESGRLLSDSLRARLWSRRVDNVGYGWFTRELAGRETWYINGRSPGFSSFLLRVPRERLIVVVLSNVYNSLPTTLGRDVALVTLGESPENRGPSLSVPSADALRSYAGTFRFGDEFYVPGGTVGVSVRDGRLESTWGALYVTNDSTFIDRAYWTTFSFPHAPTRRADTLFIDSMPGVRTEG